MVPGLGPFVGAVDAQQAAQLVDRARSVLSAQFRSPEDVQLVLSPERVLTPVFVEDLAAAAGSRPWVVLFFDTWEQTGPLLDAWLSDMILEGTFGELPLNVVVVLAGRGRLSPGWQGAASNSSTASASVTFSLVIGASSMLGSYTERFTVPPPAVHRTRPWRTDQPASRGIHSRTQN